MSEYRQLMLQTAHVYSLSVVEQLLAEEQSREDWQLLSDINKKLMQALRLQAQYVATHQQGDTNEV